MVWNLLFWLAVAYLSIAIIWRYFVPAFSKAAPRSGKDLAPAPPAAAERFFASGRTFPMIAIVLLVIPLAIQSTRGLVDIGWTDDESEQLLHFSAAMDYYDQATQLASLRALKLEDWESIKALLEAAEAEALQVNLEVLAKMDDDMPGLYRDKFLTGLRMGIFGLTQHNIGAPKGSDTLRYRAEDSLTMGRQLLSQWDDWYLPRRLAISKEIGTAAAEK